MRNLQSDLGLCEAGSPQKEATVAGQAVEAVAETHESPQRGKHPPNHPPWTEQYCSQVGEENILGVVVVYATVLDGEDVGGITSDATGREEHR